MFTVHKPNLVKFILMKDKNNKVGAVDLNLYFFYQLSQELNLEIIG